MSELHPDIRRVLRRQYGFESITPAAPRKPAELPAQTDVGGENPSDAIESAGNVPLEQPFIKRILGRFTIDSLTSRTKDTR